MIGIRLLATMALCCATTGIASATVDEDYAWQWTLSPQAAGSGAYRVTLDTSVYAAMQSRSLQDLDVVNAAGEPVPASILPALSPALRGGERVVVPWFPLPSGARDAGNDITLQVQRDADGAVRRVETRLSGTRAAQERATEAWLIDATGIEGGIAALWLEWEPTAQPLDVAYRVEGSDNLRDWRMLQPRAPLVDLVQGDQRLQQRRVALEGRARYMRLLPSDGSGTLRLTAVHAERPPSRAGIAWQWQELEGRKASERGITHYEYVLDGRFPVERVDLGLPGNSAGEWTLYSRDDASTPWTRRSGPWVSFQVGSDTAASRSAPQALDGPVRDRFWKLSGSAPSAQVPALLLGWQPELLVFVAQGQPPFRLVAGSVHATRAAAPLPQLLEAIRRQRGDAWQPAVADLGARAPLAGDRALQAGTTPEDWKSWLLWLLLVGGAVLVAGFAIALLRGGRPPA